MNQAGAVVPLDLWAVLGGGSAATGVARGSTPALGAGSGGMGRSMAPRRPTQDLSSAAASSAARPDVAGRPPGIPESLPWDKAAAAGPGPPRAGPRVFGVGTELAPGLQVLAHRRRGHDLDSYECWSRARNCRCWVKALRPDRLDSPARRRLVREARLLLSFCHPNLVDAYDLFVADPDGSPLLVLESIAGHTLNHRLLHGGRLPLHDLIQLGRQLCSVVGYLHDHRYLHLCIQSSTVVVDGDQARLIDLSSAQRPGRITRGWGTSYQISPEQARGGKLTRAADVWGVGLVLYEAATRFRPFHRPPVYGRPGRVRFLQLSSAAPPVRSLRRLPTAVCSALDACLEVHASDRPTLAELDACLAAVTDIPSLHPHGEHRRSARWRSEDR
jgi:eukaryotic-like serine/threonine-protein kinase